MIHKVRAVVLWSRRSRDADKVVGLYTDRMGRLTARATGAVRTGAKFAALSEPFVESEMAVHLVPGRGWGKIVGGRLVRSFPLLRTNLRRTTAAAWASELVHRFTPEEQPSPEKYELFVESLAALEYATCFGVLRLAFALRFLSLAGLGVDNRGPWIDFEANHPPWAEALRRFPLAELADAHWEDPAVNALEQLVSGIIADHVTRPLDVNRFRQMTGVAI